MPSSWHGRGKRALGEGDFYDGEWQNGVSQGIGSYIYANHNETGRSFTYGCRCNERLKDKTVGSTHLVYTGVWREGTPRGNAHALKNN